jgi:hypothetical protein
MMLGRWEAWNSEVGMRNAEVERGRWETGRMRRCEGARMGGWEDEKLGGRKWEWGIRRRCEGEEAGKPGRLKWEGRMGSSQSTKSTQSTQST